MIKLKQVTTVKGETTLIFEVDFPDESIRDVEIQLEEIVQRLRRIRELLGRQVTLQDVREVVIAIVDQLRHNSFHVIHAL